MNIDSNKNFIADHIDRNPLNNRKYNFRIVNHQQNIFNSSLSKNNTSGVKGISWYERDQKWQANIMYNYKNIYLGRYENIEDAIQVRLEAEKEYFGEYAPQRHLFGQYNIKEKLHAN